MLNLKHLHFSNFCTSDLSCLFNNIYNVIQPVAGLSSSSLLFLSFSNCSDSATSLTFYLFITYASQTIFYSPDITSDNPFINLAGHPCTLNCAALVRLLLSSVTVLTETAWFPEGEGKEMFVSASQLSRTCQLFPMENKCYVATADATIKAGRKKGLLNIACYSKIK